VRAILRVLKRRNFVGKNGNFNIRCHQLNRPSFLVGVRTWRFLVRAGRLTLSKKAPLFRPRKTVG
ncbi:hypothetical protein NEUTE1DRAFT_48620, partial [Neurospora tetrasperma FGSC 2508]